MRKVIVNISGGVDSTAAILEALAVYPKEELTLCYQDTGADHPETTPHVEYIARVLDLPLVILKPVEDFWQLSKRRGIFPTPQHRHCTSYLKRDLFNHWLTVNFKGQGHEIIVVNGIRGEESPGRALCKEWQDPADARYVKTASKLWHPCLDMSKLAVKERVMAEGLELHPCYQITDRCSCWCCIFAHPNIVRAFAELHPELYEKACLAEDGIGMKWSYKYNIGFNDLMKQGRLV